MTTVNLSFPWFFAAMCQNFTSYSKYSEEPYEGVFLYTTEHDGKVYANMAATDMNIAVRIKWREEYSSGQVLHHIDNEHHAVKLLLAREHLAMMKGNYLQLEELKESSAVFSSASMGGSIKVNVPFSGRDDVRRYIDNFFEDMFFSPTLEDWDARKLDMSMPAFAARRLEMCSLKKYGFDKVLSKYEKNSEDAITAMQIHGLCRPTQVAGGKPDKQDSEGLHGISFPQYPRSFKWYRDVNIQVVLMPLQSPTKPVYGDE